MQLQAGAEGPASQGAAITSNRFEKLCLVGGTARAWGVEMAPGNKPPMGLTVGLRCKDGSVFLKLAEA